MTKVSGFITMQLNHSDGDVPDYTRDGPGSWRRNELLQGNRALKKKMFVTGSNWN
jgi:hypothetical protein